MNRTARAVGFLGLSAIAFAGVLVFSSGTGCIDTTPIYVEAVDTGARAADGGTPCLDCIKQPTRPGPGCTDELKVCINDPRCNVLYECVLGLECLEAPSVPEKIRCGLPCALEAGVTSLYDPSLTLVLNVVQCGATKCSVPCQVDGGIDFDAL